MPRLFTALKIDFVISEQLSLMQGGIRGARWILPDDYHLTLRFIGDVDGIIANAIIDGLSEISFPSFELQLFSIGCFGGKKPRSLWVGVMSSEPLLELQRHNEVIAQKVGLLPGPRKYTPHVTLARLKQAPVHDVSNYLGQFGNFKSSPFKVKEFTLYSSRSSTGGGPYIAEQVFQLEK